MCRRKRRQEEKENKSSGGGFLGFLGFLVTIIFAVVYIIQMILQFVGKKDGIETVLLSMQYLTSILSIILVGILGWRFVKNRAKWLKVVYVLLIIIVAVCLLACLTQLYK